MTETRPDRKKPPKRMGKSIKEPTSELLATSEFGVLASSAEAGAERAIKLIREGYLASIRQ